MTGVDRSVIITMAAIGAPNVKPMIRPHGYDQDPDQIVPVMGINDALRLAEELRVQAPAERRGVYWVCVREEW
jgi:hypothetical protein